jgi:hypothetical protein
MAETTHNAMPPSNHLMRRSSLHMGPLQAWCQLSEDLASVEARLGFLVVEAYKFADSFGDTGRLLSGRRK